MSRSNNIIFINYKIIGLHKPSKGGDKMVKVHLWKSELALCITALESYMSKEKSASVQLDQQKDVLKKLTKAYNSAER